MLSLFTSEQRASEIEGDLIEEAVENGRSWFVIHVFRTTFALFRNSLTQSPLRIALLGAAAASLWVLACGVFEQTFFAAAAPLPVPVLGLLATIVSAYLTGVVLELLWPGFGVRSAAMTNVFLVLLFFFAQAISLSKQTAGALEAGMGAILMQTVMSCLLILATFLFAIAICLAPIMAGSVYARNRIAGG